MAQIDTLNLIGVGEALNGTGNEGIGEPDVLNRPLRNLVALLEAGNFDMYAPKFGITTLVDNNEFEATVATDDVVRMDPVTGKYHKAVPDPVSAIGFADLTNILVQTGGVKTFTTSTFTKGYYYYLSKTIPGKIVDMYDIDKSPLLVGMAVDVNKLQINFQWDFDQIDNSIPMAIVFGY